MPLTKQIEKPRIKTLDSLRGIAALMVVFTHVFGASDNEKLLHLTPFYIFKAGHEAVVFFFVLSGYVLVYQYASNPDYRYGKFIIQRIFRIYVPYAVSILLAILLLALSTPNHLATTWVNSMWLTPISAKIIVKHFIFIGNYNTNVLSPVIWSLMHEMRMSIIFPLLLLVVSLKPAKALVLTITAAVIAAVGIADNFEQAFGYLNSYSFTVYYFYIFTLGGLIAKNKLALTGWYGRQKTSIKTWYLIIALLLYNYANVGRFLFETVPSATPANDILFLAVGDLITAVASCYFVIAAISMANNNILTTRVPAFLGKISYSLYLVHPAVLAFVYFSLYGKLPVVVIMMIGFVTALLVATFFNKYVEQPAAKLAKRVIIRNFREVKPTSA